jgi:hypothetical protein
MAARSAAMKDMNMPALRGCVAIGFFSDEGCIGESIIPQNAPHNGLFNSLEKRNCAGWNCDTASELGMAPGPAAGGEGPVLELIERPVLRWYPSQGKPWGNRLELGPPVGDLRLGCT